MNSSKPPGGNRNPYWPLILLTHATCGLFFGYETAGALAPDLGEQRGFTSNQIGLLYSGYSVPVFFSIILCQYLHVKVGSANCVILFSFLIAFGSVIVAIAPNFPTMLTGQFIFGFGSTPMFITTSIIIGKWFGVDAAAKKRLLFTYGIVASYCRFYSFASFVFLPIISRRASLTTAIWSSAIVCTSAFASGLTFYIIDKRTKYTLKEFTEEKSVPMEPLGENPEASLKEDTTSAVVLKAESNDLTMSSDSSMVEVFIEKQEEVAPTTSGKYSGITDTLKIFRDFPASYWVILWILILFVSDLYTSTAFLTKYEDWKINSERAALYTSFVCLSNVITSPIAGLFSGYTGWRGKLIILGSINLVVIHSIFATTKAIPAYILTSALGLTQSIMDTSLQPSITFIVSQKHLSNLAFCSIMYNAGLLLLPTLCGYLQDVTHSWFYVNISFVCVSVCALILAVSLKIIDQKNGNIIDYPLFKVKQ